MIDWIKEIRSNENATLQKIYTDFRAAFLMYIQKDNKVSNDEAIELFQTSVIILYDNVMQKKIEKIDNIKSYLFTIGRNKAYELFRRKKKNTNFEDISFAHYVAEESASEKVELELHIQQMQRVLIQMGSPCKTLLELFYFKKLANNEIAVLMDYQNGNTVKTKKYKCIQRARKLFKEINAQIHE
jgi:RNA polymerase sigma-70 factor (ECF subfamily)